MNNWFLCGEDRNDYKQSEEKDCRDSIKAGAICKIDWCESKGGGYIFLEELDGDLSLGLLQ